MLRQPIGYVLAILGQADICGDLVTRHRHPSGTLEIDVALGTTDS